MNTGAGLYGNIINGIADLLGISPESLGDFLNNVGVTFSEAFNYYVNFGG